MWLQVSAAVRGQTDQAGFLCLTVHPVAEVTRHIPRLSWGTTVLTLKSHPLEKLQQVSELCIDLQFGGSVESVLTQWTPADVTEGPVVSVAALAEVVSPESGHGFSEDTRQIEQKKLPLRLGGVD